jgi:hypothetical protein
MSEVVEAKPTYKAVIRFDGGSVYAAEKDDGWGIAPIQIEFGDSFKEGSFRRFFSAALARQIAALLIEKADYVESAAYAVAPVEPETPVEAPPAVVALDQPDIGTAPDADFTF